MASRATYPPILAQPSVCIATAPLLLRYVALASVTLALFSGCSSANSLDAKKSPRSPKVFHQATSSVRSSATFKGSARKKAATYEPTEEQSAITAIVGIGKPAVPELIKTLRSENPTARRQAALALSKIGPDAKDAVDELIVALDDQDPTVRRAAARALGNIGPAAERAVPYLVRVMSGEPADTTIDDEYSVAPPRVENRGSSAKTLVRPDVDDSIITKGPPPGPPSLYDAGTDDVAIESTHGQPAVDQDVQPTDFELEVESSEEESAATMEDEAGDNAAASEPPAPSKYAAPSKLTPKKKQASPKGKQ